MKRTDLDDARRRWIDWLGALGLIALVLAAYSRLVHAGYIWDDDAHITANATLRNLAGLRRMWTSLTALPQFYPLTHTTFWLEYHAWQLKPLGYHLDNVLLHAISSILLWRLLLRLRVPGAFLAAAIFAVHPVNVESVAWITERKNVLSAALYLSAMHLAVRIWNLDDGTPASPIAWPICFALFVMALLSKTVTCTLPAAVLLLIWWKRGRITRRDVLPLVPFFLLGATLGLITAYLERTHVGASGPDWAFTPVQRCLIAGRAVCFYAMKLVWPHPLQFIYSRWDLDGAQPMQWLFPLIVIGVVALLFTLRARIGRGPLTAVLFFIGTLFPALGFSNVYPMRYSFVADHFQYLAGIGLIVLLAAGLSQMKAAGYVIGIAIIGLFAALTFHQTRIYHDAETLWRDTLAYDPNCVMARINYGAFLLRHNRLDEAEDQFLHAIAIRDEADVRVNLGQVLEKKGDTAHAAAQYAIAARLRPRWPEPYYRMGRLDESIGQRDLADACYRQALFYEESHFASHLSLGLLLAAQGHLAEAAVHFRRAVEIDPTSIPARQDLIRLLVAEKNDEEASQQIEALLAIDPSNAEAYNSRGLVAAHRADYAAAAADFRRALALKPEFPAARNNLNAALAASTRPAATQPARSN